MSNLKASVVLDLVDRISRPVRRIEQRFSQLGRSRGLQQLRQAVAGVGQQWNNVTSQAGRLTRRLTMVGGAAAGAAWGFERLVGGVTESADATVKTADRLGVPIERLQEWRYGAERSGLATQTFDMALQRFTRRAAEAAAGTGEAVGALNFLNIQLRDADGNLRPATELLPEVADALATVEDPATRVRAAFKLFDSEGVAMLNFLGSGSQGMRELAQEAHNAGVVMDEAFARQAEAYNDTMMDFRRTLLGVRIALVRDILPALTEWLQRLKEVTQGNRELITQRLIEGLRQFWVGVQQVGRTLAWTADLLGGWGRLAGLVAAILAGPLILSLVQLGLSLFGVAKAVFLLARAVMPAAIVAVRAFGVALMTTPVGWILAAIAAIAGAAYLIVRHWEPISAFVGELWADIQAWFGQGISAVVRDLLSFSPAALLLRAIDEVFVLFGARPLSEIGAEWIATLVSGLSSAWQAVTTWASEHLEALGELFGGYSLVEIGGAWIDSLKAGIAAQWQGLTGWLRGKLETLTGWLPDWAQERLGLESLPTGPALGGNILDDQALDGALAVGGETRVGGELRITIDSEGRSRVDELRRDGPMDLDVDLGNWRVWP